VRLTASATRSRPWTTSNAASWPWGRGCTPARRRACSTTARVQTDLWIKLYPAEYVTPDWLEFDSMVNLRPMQENRTRLVEDPDIRARVVANVDRLVAG